VGHLAAGDELRGEGDRPGPQEWDARLFADFEANPDRLAPVGDLRIDRDEHPRRIDPAIAKLGVDPFLDRGRIGTGYRSLTRSVIPADRQTAIEKTVLNLDALDDISELTALLTPTALAALE
jgi:hypothetical protein